MRDAGGVHIQPLPAASVPEPQRPIGPFGLLRWIEVRERPRYRYAYVVLAIALATSISVASFRFVDLANLVMVYLLAVVIVAARLGKGPATATTVGGVATFVYIFVPEYHSFVVADLHYLPTFLIMAGVGLVVATLTSQLRAEVVATEAREARGVALYELSGDLAATEDRVSIAAVVGKHVQRTFRCRSTLIENTAAGWRPIGTVASDMDERDLQVAHQAMTERRALRVGAQVFQPLIVTNEVIGILRSDGHDLTTLLTATEQQLLASFAHSIAIALHRLVVKEQAQAASHRAEQERLRNVMLSSVSHDLRTPLASITGAITTLIDSGARVDEATRLDLMQSIREDAEALERQVRNMLDLTRLESGSMQARRDWHPVDEVVGCAMTRLDALLGQRRVELDVPTTLPLVFVDAVLIEQLLVNLLENAVRYTPQDQPLCVVARSADGQLELEVADRGPGIPAAERERVFGKFYRGAGHHASHGAGLGLAICRAIAELHGGRIDVTDRQGGGAAFVVRLPTGGEQPSSRPTPDVPNQTP